MQTPTDREIEALFWTANGKDPLEISIIMGISRKRVNNILYDIRTKLSAHSTPHAVAIGLKRGYIDLDQIYDKDNCPDVQDWYKKVTKFMVVCMLVICSAPYNDHALRNRVRLRTRRQGIVIPTLTVA